MAGNMVSIILMNNQTKWPTGVFVRDRLTIMRHDDFCIDGCSAFPKYARLGCSHWILPNQGHQTQSLSLSLLPTYKVLSYGAV